MSIYKKNEINTYLADNLKIDLDFAIEALKELIKLEPNYNQQKTTRNQCDEIDREDTRGESHNYDEMEGR